MTELMIHCMEEPVIQIVCTLGFKYLGANFVHDDERNVYQIQAKKHMLTTCGSAFTLTFWLYLMKHAIQNTSPDITKKVQAGDEVVKVRDTEAIQLANSKIDEIRYDLKPVETAQQGWRVSIPVP